MRVLENRLLMTRFQRSRGGNQCVWRGNRDGLLSISLSRKEVARSKEDDFRRVVLPQDVSRVCKIYEAQCRVLGKRGRHYWTLQGESCAQRAGLKGARGLWSSDLKPRASCREGVEGNKDQTKTEGKRACWQCVCGLAASPGAAWAWLMGGKPVGPHGARHVSSV